MTAKPARTPALSTVARPPGGRTALRLLLGSRLRQLRELAGITVEEAGTAIRASQSKISRMELGRVAFKQRDISELLTLYGVDAKSDRGALLAMAGRANEPGWWHQYSDVLPGWFEPYVELEQEASHIRSYEMQFVPGLLQTLDYARAVARLGHPDASGSEIERRVRLRMTRQRIMTGPDAPHLWAVVDEAALRRPLGGAAVMRRQLNRLIEATELPNVTLQVASFRYGGHATVGSSFTILRFADTDLPEVVYLEQLTSALYLDEATDTCRYREAVDRLCVNAEPPSATPDILDRLLRQLPGPPQRKSASDVRKPSADRVELDDLIAADIYRQARDRATRTSAVTYDVEQGLRQLNQRIHRRRMEADDRQGSG